MKKLIILVCCVLSVFCSCDNGEYKIAEYNLICNYENQKLLIDMQVDFSMPDNLSEVWFNLYFNAYSETAKYFAVENLYMPQNPLYGYGDILSVSTFGKELDYDVCRDGGLLKVNLDGERKKGERVTLFIKSLIKLSNFNHRLSAGEQTVNLGNFFPILCVYENGEFIHCPYYNIGDPFYSEVANYNVQINCEGSYSVAFSGECIGVEQADKTSYAFKGDNIRDFALVLSKDFKVKKEQLENTQISYYYLNGDGEEIKIVKDCLKFFSKNFYPYPYSTFSVAQSDFCYGGMEYPQIVLINKTLTGKQLLWTIVHEVAHQWWYGIVGNNQIEDAFIDEGLTEYCTNLFFYLHPEYGVSCQKDLAYKKLQYLKFTDFYVGLYGKAYNFSPSRSLAEYKNSDDYVNSVYIYTPYCFWQEASIKGQDDFTQKLASFVQKYAYKTVNSAEFLSFFKDYGLERVSGGKFPI